MISLILILASGLEPSVSQYLRDPVRIYDKSGALTGVLHPADLPKLPAPIQGYSANGQPGVMNKGVIIYLRTGDIQTEHMESSCTELATPSKSANVRIAASDLGASSGLSASNSTCISKAAK